MKLYSLKLSHYAARVRIALLFKGLTPEIAYPGWGGLKSAEYLDLNPMGRVPTLVTDDGLSLPESGVILEYLEEAYPAPSMMPASTEDRARVRLLSRIGELYVAAPLQALFPHMNPATRDEAAAKAQLDRLEDGLRFLAQHMGDGPFALEGSLTLADCVLPTMLRYLADFARVFGRPSLAEAHPKLIAYQASVRAHPAVDTVLGEMEAASVIYRATGERT